MILLTGGSGLLGRYLKIEADRPSHEDFDITNLKPPFKEYEAIIHCAAYTDVQKSELEKQKCFDINVTGTLNLLETYPGVPIVYISSEYAAYPNNFYSWTKKWAEDLIRLRPKGSYLILRTLFKATPWPFEKAFVDQWTQGDYVDVIAPLIDEAIKRFFQGNLLRGREANYIGTGRKTIYQLARRTKPDVIPNSIKDMEISIPADYA